MLRKLKITNFRSIQSAELEFGRLNLIIGGNGSGKSNLLEAIGFVSSMLARGVDEDTLSARGVRLSRPHLFKSSFKGRDLPKTFRLESEIQAGNASLQYDFSIRAGQASSELEVSGEKLSRETEKIFGRSKKECSWVTFYLDKKRGVGEGPVVEDVHSGWDAIRPLMPRGSAVVEVLQQLSQFAIFAPQTAVLRGTAVVERSTKPLGLAGTDLASCLKVVLDLWRGLSDETSLWRTLDQVLDLVFLPGWTDQFDVDDYDPSIVSGSVKAGGPSLYFRDKYMKTTRNMLSPYDASEGALYLAFVAALIGHPKTPQIFALDNVDGTLNPELVRKLVETIADVLDASENSNLPGLPKQVFLTSHNPTALDAIDLFNDEHRLFVASRNEKGHTTFKRIKPPEGTTREEWVVSARGLRLSELWLEGLIDGALG